MMNAKRLMLALGCCVAMSAASLAQMPATVTVTGSASLIGSAKQVRMTLGLTGEGKDAAAAVGDLRKQVDDAKAKLTALKPVDGTLKATDITIGEGDAGMSMMQRQQQRMMQQMRGRNAKDAPTEPKVTVSSVVTATFDLPAGAGDEAIIAHSDLQKKISDAVATKKADKKLTPEEQEILEEMGDMAAMSEAGKPSFVYVMPLSAEEAAKLTREAVEKSRAKAQALATAAGVKLGPVFSLSYGNANPADAMVQAYAQMMDRSSAEPDTDLEATATEPGPLTFEAEVTVVYQLQP